MSKSRKQLPLPDETSPFPPHKNRALPSLPSPDDAPPPPIPARPGGHRPPPPVPSVQKIPSRNPLESNQHQDTDSDADSGADSDSSYEEMDKPPPGTPPRRYKGSDKGDHHDPTMPSPKPRKKKLIPPLPTLAPKKPPHVQNHGDLGKANTKSVTSDDEQEPGIYADAEEGDLYEDEVVQQSDSDQEEYDEFEIATSPEEKTFPAPPPQEVYDDFAEPQEEEEEEEEEEEDEDLQQEYDDFEPEQQTYEMEPPSPPPVSFQDQTYESVPDPVSRFVPPEPPRVPPARPPPSVPAPPPAPSKTEAKPAHRPLPKPKESVPAPKGRGASAGPVVDLNAIMNKKGNLRKVGQPLERQNSDSKDVKDYGDTKTKPALSPSGIRGKMAMFEQNSGFNRPNQAKIPPPNRTPPRARSPSRLEQNSSNNENRVGNSRSRSPDIRSRIPDPRNRSPNTRSRSPFNESHGSTDSPPQIHSAKQALTPPTRRDIPQPVPKKESLISPAKREPPKPPPKRDPPIPRESSPPPPPIDRPPVNHPAPPPPMGSLPPPPIRKENYTQVNKQHKTELPPPPPEMNGGVSNNEEHDNDSDGEIYDEAFSKNDPMLIHDWYFGEIERDKGNQLLKTKSSDGTYLVRKSTRGGDNQPYTLMVMYNSHIYNLKIRIRYDTRFALGEEKADEISFKSVEDLISHHQKNDVILVHKSGQRYETVLKNIPKKL